MASVDPGDWPDPNPDFLEGFLAAEAKTSPTIGSLRRLVADLHWIAIHGDYRNGNTDSSGTDEGEVRATEWIAEIEKEARRLGVTLRAERGRR